MEFFDEPMEIDEVECYCNKCKSGFELLNLALIKKVSIYYLLLSSAVLEIQGYIESSPFNLAHVALQDRFYESTQNLFSVFDYWDKNNLSPCRNYQKLNEHYDNTIYLFHQLKSQSIGSDEYYNHIKKIAQKINSIFIDMLKCWSDHDPEAYISKLMKPKRKRKSTHIFNPNSVY